MSNKKALLAEITNYFYLKDKMHKKSLNHFALDFFWYAIVNANRNRLGVLIFTVVRVW